MDPSPPPTDDWPQAFKRDFARVEPMIAEEWPSLDREALAKTQGDVERVVLLLVEGTSHTRVVARAKLRELHGLAKSGRADGAADLLDDALGRLEKRLDKLAADVRGTATTALPAVKTFAKNNILFTLLVLLGLGFLLGRVWPRRRHHGR